ncbi:MAG: phage holin family protein [Bacteroidia bacterium]
MEEEKNKLETTIGHLKEYAETRLDLIVLDAQDKVSEVVSSAASYAIVGLLMFFTLLFVSIGTALTLSHYFRNPSLGFFCVAGFYLLVTLIVFAARKSLIKVPLINTVLKKLNTHHEEN